MARKTGTYQLSIAGSEEVRAFVPRPLPPKRPVLRIEGKLLQAYSEARSALKRLEIAGAMVPSPSWFLYGFVRKEALMSSQIEGTQASLDDVIAVEVNLGRGQTPDVEEVCNYVDALEYVRRELAKPGGMPICTRLLCAAHKRLMRGSRGSEKQPGRIRRVQNWIGGTSPRTARFVPPPPQAVPDAMTALEKWIHSDDSLPPLVRAGLAHVQFETIHPFLDGNGLMGRLLITILLEHWNLLNLPILYLSLGFKRNRQEYYRRLGAVRTQGDWEGWMSFYLDCVRECADDGVDAAQRLFALVAEDRLRTISHKAVSIGAMRLFEFLPEHPMVTLQKAMGLLDATKPTAAKAIQTLVQTGVLKEITGRKRDRIYAYDAYLAVLSEGTDSIPG